MPIFFRRVDDHDGFLPWLLKPVSRIWIIVLFSCLIAAIGIGLWFVAKTAHDNQIDACQRANDVRKESNKDVILAQRAAPHLGIKRLIIIDCEKVVK